jgi:gliding motility-associated lipoprotein GldD
MKIINTFFCILLTLLISCSKESLPKPRAFLRLTFDDTVYKSIKTDCPYQFEMSENAHISFTSSCWSTINYPHLKATLNLTYRPIENNLKVLLQESEKLTYKHSIKADGIVNRPYINRNHHTYGSLSNVSGNAASPIQFHLTDSVHHFITGALYFQVQPNYDSILPSIRFIEKDIKHLMETLKWQ